MDYREHGELSCSPSHVLRVHMHNAFYTGWMYSLHPFILPSCAPRRRLGQGCKCRRLHRVLWGESLLESLTPARSPWASLCHWHCRHPQNCSQCSAPSSCLLGIPATFPLASLQRVAAARAGCWHEALCSASLAVPSPGSAVAPRWGSFGVTHLNYVSIPTPWLIGHKTPIDWIT